MKKTRKILSVLLIPLVTVLLVFLFAEEIVMIKHKAFSYWETIGSQQETSATENFEEFYASHLKFVHPEDAWYQSTELIYHAGGGIDGLQYSNSKEAVEWSSRHGNVIELDFLFTSDNHLVCAHTWAELMEVNDTLTLSQFQSLDIFGKYTPMTAETLVDFMIEHEDVYIIIDTKVADPIQVVQDLLRICEGRTDIANRFIIQLYNEGEKQKVLDLYPFPEENFMFTCYKFGNDPEGVLRICLKENISVVAVPYDLWDADTIRMFTEKGIIMYEHTINRVDQALKSKGKGIHGCFTDFLTSIP